MMELRLYEVIHSNNALFLVFEHLEMDLKKYQEMLHEFDPMLAKSYLFQVCASTSTALCKLGESS